MSESVIKQHLVVLGLLAFFLCALTLTVLGCVQQEPPPPAPIQVTARGEVIVPPEVMRQVMPDGPISPDVQCPQGSICGPVLEGICGAAKCLPQESSTCCMTCQCIGSGMKFCAQPAVCGP